MSVLEKIKAIGGIDKVTPLSTLLKIGGVEYNVNKHTVVQISR